ncbi:MAG: 2-oxoisovalerate dehydrogenase [Euryarchaeota archaeon]|nr:2-oxoisovalerate dehydrogenase [Euryarchaeota archaeon]
MNGIKPMKEIIFLIEDDPRGGYNTQALAYPIFTEGKTLEAVESLPGAILQEVFDFEEDT